MEIFRQITANGIELDEFPFQKELAMEAYLYENGDILKLDKQDFDTVNVLDVEIALKEGRKSAHKDGRIDMLASYGDDYLAIIELKAGTIDHNALQQLEDYLDKRSNIHSKTEYSEYYNDIKNRNKWVGVLVGTSITPDLQKELQNGYATNDAIPVGGMVIRRFRGNLNEIYVVTDTFFKYPYTNRDFSKFEFKGEVYNKSRLVNQVIREYVDQHPKISFAELKRDFPDYLQGSIGVFTTKDNAIGIFNRTSHKRHYVNPSELIQLSDETIATCNQWGLENISRFVEHVNKMNNNFKISNI